MTWSKRPVLVCAAVVTLSGMAADAQQPDPPAVGRGRVIEAAEGDVVIVPQGARVAIVRRAEGTARLVYYPDRHTVLMIADVAGEAAPPSTKRVYLWKLLDPWPLEVRWEGRVTLDQYPAGPRSAIGLVIRTDRGGVVMGSLQRDAATTPPFPTVRVGPASVHPAAGSFDEIERASLMEVEATGAAASGPTPPAGVGGVAGGVVGGVVGPLLPGPPPPPGAAPIRVGSAIRPPRKVEDHAPVYPEIARSAGVQGVVVLEITIDPEGRVTNARVLRSIAMLDEAALDCVRQWRYEPTILNGRAVPVIAAVTVNFTLQAKKDGE